MVFFKLNCKNTSYYKTKMCFVLKTKLYFKKTSTVTINQNNYYNSKVCRYELQNLGMRIDERRLSEMFKNATLNS